MRILASDRDNFMQDIKTIEGDCKLANDFVEFLRTGESRFDDMVTHEIEFFAKFYGKNLTYEDQCKFEDELFENLWSNNCVDWNKFYDKWLENAGSADSPQPRASFVDAEGETHYAYPPTRK